MIRFATPELQAEHEKHVAGRREDRRRGQIARALRTHAFEKCAHAVIASGGEGVCIACAVDFTVSGTTLTYRTLHTSDVSLRLRVAYIVNKRAAFSQG